MHYAETPRQGGIPKRIVALHRVPWMHLLIMRTIIERTWKRISRIEEWNTEYGVLRTKVECSEGNCGEDEGRYSVRDVSNNDNNDSDNIIIMKIILTLNLGRMTGQPCQRSTVNRTKSG